MFFQVHRFQVPETYLQKVAAEQGLEGEGPWEDGEGPEVPRHCVLIAEEHFLPLAMLGAKI